MAQRKGDPRRRAVRSLFVCALLALLFTSACDRLPVSLKLPVLVTVTPLEALPVAPPTQASAETQVPAPMPTPLPPPPATPPPIGLYVAPHVLTAYGEAVARAIAEVQEIQVGSASLPVLYVPDEKDANVHLILESLGDAMAARVYSNERSLYSLAERFYALVAPFQTVRDDVSLGELQARWIGESEAPLYVTADAASELQAALNLFGAEVIGPDEMLTRLEAEPDALGILPFEQLNPRYKVMTVDGASVLSNQLDPSDYPLAVALVLVGSEGPNLGGAFAPYFQDMSNRNPAKMTNLIMTGVTAMTRGTAKRMEEHGVLYPAQVISDVLRAADITHVNNEVPFIEGCQVNLTPDNLIFCSDYDYWEALEAIGTDIVGLSGNHVNDHGIEGAAETLAFYRDRGINIFGGGDNLEQACAPLILEDHGNRLAFVATIAWGPEEAWATETTPGNCHFYDERDRLKTLVAELRDKVDLVFLELQYLETYNPFPTGQQVDEFREVREAGAHVVTGVQSHVPQAWEPYGETDPGGRGVIIYGLGNFFFDQMWSWETRTGLIARHTIYDGRLLNSEILTTVLEDYAQPRWATAEERREILRRIFDAAPERPVAVEPLPVEDEGPASGETKTTDK